MKGKVKKTLIGVAALAFAFAGVGSLASYEAKANTPALFEMVEGASVRTSADTSGIRFSLRVNSDQQTALSAYKAVEYGMLITQESEATIDEIYNAGEAVFAEDGDWSFNKEDIATKKYLANITGDTLVDEKDDEGVATGNKLFNAALTNISQANFTKTYVGVGYIKTTSEGATDSADDDVVTYHFASKNNNERTITYVAEKALAENDENAVGKEVVENYVSGGYANLGLTVANTEEEAGTETNPYVVEETDCAGLINATNNNLIYGANKFMTFADGVDNAKITTDFAMDRAYTFIQTHDYEQDALALDYFDSPSTKAAAYGMSGTNTSKSVMNETAEWHEAYEGRYGVISLNRTRQQTWTNVYNVYHVMSTVRDKDYMDEQEIADITENTLWDYVSMWIYIAGEDGESVTVAAQQGRGACEVPCNTWWEYRIALDVFVIYCKTPWNTLGYDSALTSANNACLLAIQSETDYTVYVDSMAYVKTEDAFSVSVADSGNSDNKANITVTPNTGYENAFENATYTYYVRAYGTVESSGKAKEEAITATTGKFSLVKSDRVWTKFWVCVKVEIAGELYLSHCIYELPTA